MANPTVVALYIENELMGTKTQYISLLGSAFNTRVAIIIGVVLFTLGLIKTKEPSENQMSPFDRRINQKLEQIV